jgi:hypothetical protein
MLIGQCGQLKEFHWFVRAHWKRPTDPSPPETPAPRRPRPSAPRGTSPIRRHGPTSFGRKVFDPNESALRVRSPVERTWGLRHPEWAAMQTA